MLQLHLLLSFLPLHIASQLNVRWLDYPPLIRDRDAVAGVERLLAEQSPGIAAISAHAGKVYNLGHAGTDCVRLAPKHQGPRRVHYQLVGHLNKPLSSTKQAQSSEIRGCDVCRICGPEV